MGILNTYFELKILREYTAIGICVLAFSSCDSPITVTLTAEEFRFSPTQLVLPAYERVRIFVRNQGRERHVFESEILSRESIHIKGNSVDRKWRAGEGLLLKPGQTIELSMVLDPGRYSFRCRIQGHRGMEGVLRVGGREAKAPM